MQKLPCEIIMKRHNGEEKTFILRRCVPEDLDEIVALQDEVYDYISDKKIFQKTEADEFAESIELDQCFCFMDGNKMIAFTLMVAARPGYRNYGEYLDYTPEQLAKTVSMDTSFVLPEYRGFGLQQFFFELREQAATELLGATEALTTIAPDNEYSLNNAYKTGYEEIRRMTIYGGLERCILRKVF